MAPTRTPKASTSSRTLDGPHHSKRPNPRSASESTVPGVQKIKSAIRQTKRLLAKEKLDADKRVTAERKLVSLEDDLRKAETARIEKNYATKYHMVRFFERQKIVRKISQAVKAGDDDALRERRIDLNYILHYPKTQKYISLLKTGEDGAVNVQREEFRERVRTMMENGEVDAQPERRLRDDGHGSRKVAVTSRADAQGERPERVARQVPGVESDDFFADEDSEEEE